MPPIERRAPRPATVEEFDEDRQVALPESLRTANVSGRRPQQEVFAKQGEQSLRNGGSDSGYASRADTVSTGSTSVGRRKMPDLRVDTAAAIPERTRQPYSSSKAEPTRQPSRRQSSSQGQPPANPAKSKPISQEPEIRHRYDHYAKHGDMRTDVSATSSAPPPPSPRTVRQTGPKTSKDDTALPTKVRRSSSQQQSRPNLTQPDQAGGLALSAVVQVSSRESRPPLPSHKSSRSIDHDRVLMPPPAKPPQYQPETTHRPSTRRAKTYHVQQSPVHQHFTHNLERFDEDFEDYGYRESRMPLPPTRERRESSSRPPTSYRGARVATEARDRPALPAKSMSYSTSAGLAKTPSRPNIATRQTTQSAVAADDGEMAVEEYLERRNKTSNELTAEALRNLNHRNTSSRSETESSYSHKSRQSSSKESSGLGKSQATTASTMKTSIALSGGGVNMSISPDYMSNDGRPVSISIGNVVVKVATQESEAADRSKEVRRVERAPSVASRASKNSFSLRLCLEESTAGDEGHLGAKVFGLIRFGSVLVWADESEFDGHLIAPHFISSIPQLNTDKGQRKDSHLISAQLNSSGPFPPSSQARPDTRRARYDWVDIHLPPMGAGWLRDWMLPVPRGQDGDVWQSWKDM
ncbi:hypothetical protein KCU88_g6079, partial [Aureobasidium melanogenum]